MNQPLHGLSVSAASRVAQAVLRFACSSAYFLLLRLPYLPFPKAAHNELVTSHHCPRLQGGLTLAVSVPAYSRRSTSRRRDSLHCYLPTALQERSASGGRNPSHSADTRSVLVVQQPQ